MANDRTFTYSKGDVKIVAPYFEDAMSAGFLRRHRNDTSEEQMFAVVEEALDEENLAAFDRLPMRLRDGEDPKTTPTMDDFYTTWQEDAGITAGE